MFDIDTNVKRIIWLAREHTLETQLHIESLNCSEDSPISTLVELSGGSRCGAGLMVDVEEENSCCYQLELLSYQVTNLTSRFPAKILTFKHQFF